MVTVIVTTFPASAGEGVYVKLNGEALAFPGFTFPKPLWLRLTTVALPPKVLPLTVIGVTPQVAPSFELRVTTGALAQPQFTFTLVITDSHCVLSSLTLTVCAPFDTVLKVFDT